MIRNMMANQFGRQMEQKSPFQAREVDLYYELTVVMLLESPLMTGITTIYLTGLLMAVKLL